VGSNPEKLTPLQPPDNLVVNAMDLGDEVLVSELVRFAAQSGLKLDITRDPKSAIFRTHAAQQCLTYSPRQQISYR
jgi:hypothetical protein